MVERREVMTAPLLSPAPLREVLPNGLTVLLLEDRSAPLATLQAWFRTGSIHEGRHLGCGISHFVEHMLFKGTPTRKVGEFAREIAAAGGHSNAYTHTERTVYHLHIRSAAFASSLAALADVVRRSTFDPAETDKEREVILRELEDGLESPQRLLWSLFSRTAYRVHPYQYPIIGFAEAFRRLSRADLVEYHGARYVPNQAVLLAVGDFRAEDALGQVKEAFGDWPMRPLPPVYVPKEPAQCGRRTAAETFRSKDTRMLLGYHTVPATDPDMFALDVLAYILGIGRASRLTRAVRDGKGLVFDVDAGSSAGGEPGMFLVSAKLAPENEGAALAAILEEIERFKADPAAPEELERARNKVLAGFYYGRQTVEHLAQALGVNELIFANLDFDRQYVDAIRAVTADDLVRTARRYFNERNLTVAAIRPLSPPVASAAVASTDGGTEANRETLPCGATLIVQPNRKLPLVSMFAVLHGGVRYEDATHNGISHLTAQLLTRGTARRDAEEIDATVESVGAALEGVSGRNTIGIAATAMREHFDRVADLLAECLLEPDFPERRVEQVRSEMRSRIRARLERPMEANALLFYRTFYGPHPYARPPLGSEETVVRLTRDNCRDFHARVLAPTNLVLTVVGDVTLEEARARFGAALAGIPARPAPTLHHPPPAPPSAVEVVQDIGNEKLTAVMLGFPTIDVRSPDRFPLEILHQTLSSMGGRLFVRLRDELALAYQVGCSSMPLVEPGHFAFHILTRPDQVRTALAEMRAQIDALRRDGVDERELAEAKAALIGADLNDLQTNGSRAQAMGLDELYGLGYANRFDYPRHVESVTRADVQRVAERYFVPEREVTAITGRTA